MNSYLASLYKDGDINIMNKNITQRQSLEYCIDQYSGGLSFMQRNSIRYEFMTIFKQNIFLRILSINKIISKHDDTIMADKISLINYKRSIIGYELDYTFRKDVYSKIQKKTLFIPLYINPYQLVKSMIFYYYLDKKNKKDIENEEQMEIYFKDYNNYDYQYI
jgi:hypothetical protein